MQTLHPAERVRRFWARVDKTDSSGCWIWTGHIAANGYGKNATGASAHRYAYEQSKGPIPEGLHIDHLCFVRACVNPAHLEAVTPLVNIRRAPTGNYLKTHCEEGHEYAGGNLYVHKGKRYCRACRRETQRRYLLRKQAA